MCVSEQRLIHINARARLRRPRSVENQFRRAVSGSRDGALRTRKPDGLVAAGAVAKCRGRGVEREGRVVENFPEPSVPLTSSTKINQTPATVPNSEKRKKTPCFGGTFARYYKYAEPLVSDYYSCKAIANYKIINVQ